MKTLVIFFACFFLSGCSSEKDTPNMKDAEHAIAPDIGRYFNIPEAEIESVTRNAERGNVRSIQRLVAHYGNEFELAQHHADSTYMKMKMWQQRLDIQCKLKKCGNLTVTPSK
jgi:PBP1b-binding outer membrane lipoprotein LpoB